jgi:hypothetical protein
LGICVGLRKGESGPAIAQLAGRGKKLRGQEVEKTSEDDREPQVAGCADKFPVAPK